MYTSEYSCYGLRPAYTKRVTFLAVMAVIALVCYGINFYLGQRVPKALKGTDPYFLAAAVLFAFWAMGIYFSRRIRVHVHGDDQSLQVEVNDPESDQAVLLKYPFSIARQWTRVRNGETHTKELYLTFLDPIGIPLLTFKSSLGDLRDVPPRFDFVDIRIQSRLQLKVAEQLYHTKVMDIEDLLNTHLVYLSTMNPGNS